LTESPAGAGSAELRVFVYGTLKRGERNHERYCRGALRVVPATTAGWLYDLHRGHPALGLGYGYPALVVPDGAILATGTTDYASDAAASADHPASLPAGAPKVRGELISFGDPETRLRALDALEGFLPEGNGGPYRRVLIPALPEGSEAPVAVWTYVVAEGPPGTFLPGGFWSARKE